MKAGAEGGYPPTSSGRPVVEVKRVREHRAIHERWAGRGRSVDPGCHPEFWERIRSAGCYLYVLGFDALMRDGAIGPMGCRAFLIQDGAYFLRHLLSVKVLHTAILKCAYM